MLAGNVVSAAIRQAQLQSQIEITRQMLELQATELDITERRVEAGGFRSIEVNRQRTAVEQTRADYSTARAATRGSAIINWRC